jgi:hypothetical protein
MADEDEKPKVVVRHMLTGEEPEPCMVCKEGTRYRAVVEAPKDAGGFLALLSSLNVQIRKAVCPECIDDTSKMTRLLGRAIKTIKVGTRTLPNGRSRNDE